MDLLKNLFSELSMEKFSSKLFLLVFQVNTRVTRKFRGHLIQILFNRIDEAINETSPLGYAVVKFAGDRECKYCIK